MGSKTAGFKVKNPTERDIILNRFEGDDTFVVPAGKSLTTDNQRAALTLVEAGCTIEQETYEAALAAESKAEAEDRSAERQQRRDRDGSGLPTVVNGAAVAPVGAQTVAGEAGEVTPESEEVIPAHPSEPTGDGVEAEELKGAALDEALESLGLPKTGTADEKRARHADALDAIKAQEQPEA